MATVVDINSDEGKVRLQNAKSNKSFHEWIQVVFSKQKFHSGCGLRTTAILLTAAEYARSNPTQKFIPECQQPFTEKGLMDSENFKAISSFEKLDKVGTTLDEVCRLMKSYNYNIKSFKASETSLKDFRALLAEVCKSQNSLMGVNYCLKTLQFKLPYGHHSPIAAYDDKTDSVLIMDTWPDHGEYWVDTSLLWESMDTLDIDSNERRGFYVLYNDI
ncbi:unnamed protein product [Dimorphilus gyrociliatus]|uniref:glutathione gamma-glutamylcysteinyltransferase n=1 Tax=Dimorphilus gyrociliatus TaxID=2664684 RepID=A0A7I8VDT4_9ANNE|nr:unnamed protein product [Dimorphilus gyrociliatus]